MNAPEYAVETSDLTKVYGKRVTAVDHLNLRVRRREVYGFLGPNGAGKTTTLPDAPRAGSRDLRSRGRAWQAAGRSGGSVSDRGHRGRARLLPVPLGRGQPPRRGTPGGPSGPYRSRPRGGRSPRAGGRPDQDVFPGDAAAPRRRRGPAQGPGAADPGRGPRTGSIRPAWPRCGRWSAGSDRAIERSCCRAICSARSSRWATGWA